MKSAALRNFPLTAIASALILGGCGTIGGHDRIVADPSITAVPSLAPTRSAAQRAGLSIERWWLVFDDERLEQLIEEALQRNEDLELAAARVQEARASLDVARAAGAFTLDLQARSSRARQSEVAAMPLPRGVDREAPTHRISLDAGYEIDLWGRLEAGNAAARHRLLATEWARSAIEWGLTARLAEAYFSLAAVDRQIELGTLVRDSRQATQRARQSEHEAGSGSEFELRRAEGELASSESTLAGLERQRVSYEKAILVLLGRTPTEVATRAIARRAIDEANPQELVLPQGGADQLLVRRPDIRQAEEQLAAANESIAAARAATLPSVRLSGSLGSDTRTFAKLFTGPAAIFSIAASLAQSIADGGRLEARVNEERARARQSLASYRKTVTGAVLELRESYEALDHLDQAMKAERVRSSALGRARAVAQAGFKKGALSRLDLLDMERNHFQAQLQQVAVVRDRLVGQIAVFKALGGGYAAPLVSIR